MSVPARSPSPDESVRQQILAAIRGELEAVRARQCRRPVWHAIGRGRCGSLDASGAVYVFGPSQHVSVRRDQVVELSVGAYTTCARVLAVTEGELVLACFERLGDTTRPSEFSPGRVVAARGASCGGHGARPRGAICPPAP